jgi:hypothetical protein
MSTDTGSGRRVTDAEVLELGNELMARGELWNGMIAHYLRERYGDRLRRVWGEDAGWYVLPAQAR